MKHHECALSGPANDSFARKITMDSRINIGIGTIACQKWDVSVFVLSSERPCDWGDLAGVGATAPPPQYHAHVACGVDEPQATGQRT